ncbi:hypothetical protein EJ04DRAFT_60287 [Polyplosphaeria fusca]|uniref:Uncharacterized protein n=1 Tax=Polyplosphaeria fusca TaxID=682080 RepID=A0A9P4V7A4_9PLEO|nr:hypothetical protein EJ04DRAFT_60287 [Polyplosphaeria fusca]
MGDKLVGWTSSPNDRGTIDIIWSCIFVVFLSTWTTLHNNVPPVKKGSWWRLWNKALLMGVGLLAPEYMATIAFTELRIALTVQGHMKDIGYDEWSLSQSFFVAMGGYMVYFNGDHKPISAENFIKWHRSGLIRVLRSTETIAGEPTSNTVENADVEMTVVPKLVKAPKLASYGSEIELPWVSTEDIASRGKADFFLKGIACAQIGWILVQYIARRAQSLATSSLEALTVAYIVCALFSYSAWWRKPYDLESPTAVAISPEHEVASLLKDSPLSIPLNDDPDLPILHNVLWTYLVPCTAAALTFSSLHFLAWDNYFDTVTEEWLWRASSIMFVWFHIIFLGFAAHMEKNMNISPTAAKIAKMGFCSAWKAGWYVVHGVKLMTCGNRSAMLNWIDAALQSKCDPVYTPKGPYIVFFISHTSLFCVGRILVLIDAFASLRRAPVGLYDSVDWAAFIPHVH